MAWPRLYPTGPGAVDCYSGSASRFRNLGLRSRTRPDVHNIYCDRPGHSSLQPAGIGFSILSCPPVMFLNLICTCRTANPSVYLFAVLWKGNTQWTYSIENLKGKTLASVVNVSFAAIRIRSSLREAQWIVWSTQRWETSHPGTSQRKVICDIASQNSRKNAKPALRGKNC